MRNKRQALHFVPCSIFVGNMHETLNMVVNVGCTALEIIRFKIFAIIRTTLICNNGSCKTDTTITATQC